ncbi:MAG: DUF2127 domain-containing protein [Candidatus Moranbacteria bacterium]|nr:DUF2127 domain-containing protein [Candidatus Moranbacteria bacterium]
MDKMYAKVIHDTFRVGILLKGLNGILEIIGGILLFFIRPETLNYLVRLLTQNELSEDPKDLFANFLVHAARGFSVSSQIFGGLFLLSHGLIKIFLIAALFRKKLWAYPLAIAVFGIFIFYQMYRYSISHSAWLIVLTILDIFVVTLTYLEYQNLKTRQI